MLKPFFSQTPVIQLRIANGKIHGPGGAAELLGMNPNTLRWRLDKLGIRYRRRDRKISHAAK
jgi:hypothetical protein